MVMGLDLIRAKAHGRVLVWRFFLMDGWCFMVDGYARDILFEELCSDGWVGVANRFGVAQGMELQCSGSHLGSATRVPGSRPGEQVA